MLSQAFAPTEWYKLSVSSVLLLLHQLVFVSCVYAQHGNAPTHYDNARTAQPGREREDAADPMTQGVPK